MPQPGPVVTHGSLRVQSGSSRGNMEISRPIRFSGMEEEIRSPPDHPITALPVRRPFRDSQSSTPLSPRMRAYGGVVSHHPQVSVSSHISHDTLLHRRRGSTLKTVMRKLFGRKRQSNLEGEDIEEGLSTLKLEKDTLPVERDQMLFTTAQSLRSSSSPTTSNKKRSLVISRLSSASSDNLVGASQEKRIEIPQQTVRRRATLPSLILSEDGAAKDEAFSLISPVSTRPVSAMSESAVSIIDEEHAIRDDAQSQLSLKAHRRSRSADALQDLVRHHRMSPIQWRRRSDEVKAWHNSGSDEDNNNTVDKQTSSTHRTPSPNTEDEDVPNRDEGGVTPSNELKPAPFHIENLIASMADPDATIEQRMTTLEVKLMDLEFAIAKIQGTENDAFTKSVNNTPEKGKGTVPPHRAAHSEVEPTSAASETSSQSSASFGGDARPISTSTLRPHMSYAQPSPWQASSSSLNLHSISIEQYSALITLVRREQTARKALESQVALMQEEMQNMRRASGLPASPPGTLYPIPSPDSDDARNRRRREASSSRKGSATSADTRGSEPRQWDSSHYRSTIDTNSRNATTNMI